MRRVWCGLLLSACLVLIACTPVISKKEFDQKSRQAVNYSNTLLGQVFYSGTKDGHDYFSLEPALGVSSRVCVKEGEVAVAKRFPYSRDRSHWILLNPWVESTTNSPVIVNNSNSTVIMIEPKKTAVP